MKKMLNKSAKNEIIAIHNHPGSNVPSTADLIVCKNRGYKFGLVVCHNGKIYKYSVDKDKFNLPIVAAALDWMEAKGYTEKVKKNFMDAGVKMEVF